MAGRDARGYGRGDHDLENAGPARADSEKKSLRATEQMRADVAEARRLWRELQPRLDVTRLVFLDETWAKTNMTRLLGRAPRGERLIGSAPTGIGTRRRFWPGCATM